MKIDLKRYVRLFREGCVQVMRAYPVEMLLALYACVCGLLTYELEWEHSYAQLNLVPIFFALALTVNNLAGRSAWRRLYWVCWMPIVPLSLWPGLEAWIGSSQHVITLGILAPLALLASLRAVCNDRFVADAFVWLRSVVLALFFAHVALGLFYAILYSTTYIFGLEGRWIRDVAVWAVTICESLVVPTLFLMMFDRWRGAGLHGNRLLEVLLNYLVTPALLIYAAIFYLYMVKIVVTWTLPEGGVAYLAFGFTMTALVVKALDRALERRIYSWFYDRLSMVSLPMIVLFWVGVARRIGEYGLTAQRVYLLVCGALMTFCVVLFLSRRFGRYLWVCLAGLVVFAAFAYIPALSPERIGLRSQTERFGRIARSLALIDQTGRLRTERVPLSDTVRWREYREAFEALEYVLPGDSLFRRQLGLRDDERSSQVQDRLLPARLRALMRGWGDVTIESAVADDVVEVELPRNLCVASEAAWPNLYLHISHWTVGGDGFFAGNDSVRLTLGGERVLQLSGEELVRTQLERTGLTYDRLSEMDDAQTVRFLDYRNERVRILFRNLKVERRDSLGYGLGGATVEAAMIR